MYKRTGKQLDVEITPSHAAKLLNESNPEYRRPLENKHLRFIIDKIENGLFLDGNIAIAKNADGTTWLANGNHTLTAVVSCGKAIRANIYYFECPSREDECILFKQFDSAFSSKTANQYAGCEVIHNRLEWSPRFAQLIIGAAAYNKGESYYSRTSSEEKSGLLKYNLRVGAWVRQIIGEPSKSARHMAKMPVVAAMMRTMAKCAADATAFWTRVRDGEELKKNMPEYHLREFLLTHSTRIGNQGVRPSQIASNHEYLYRAVNSWNAFRKGEKREIAKYYPAADIPKVI